MEEVAWMWNDFIMGENLVNLLVRIFFSYIVPQILVNSTNPPYGVMISSLPHRGAHLACMWKDFISWER